MSLSSPTPLIDQTPEQQEACKRRIPRYFDVVIQAQAAAREAGRPVPHTIDVLQETQSLTSEQWRATGEEHFELAEGLLTKANRTSYDVAVAQVHATLAAAAATAADSAWR